MLQRAQLFIIFIVITFLLLSWIFNTVNKYSITRLREVEINHLQSEANTIDEIFRSVIGDIHFLSSIPEFQNFNKGTFENDREHVNEMFYDFAQAKGIYAQIRFLDTLGNEIIRINHKEDQTNIVSRVNLQNKKDRYYFKDAILLPPKKVYVSPFDLNVENGRIEEPHNPMIRFAEPIYNELGEKQGIIILNYRGKNLLKKIKSRMNSKYQLQTFLLNQDSYFFIGPSPADEWGFMFQNKLSRNMQNYYPTAWKSMQNNSEGLVFSEKGLFIYKTITPMPNKVISSLGDNSDNSSIIDSAHYYWKIVSFLPAEKLQLIQEKRYSIFYVIFFLISFILAHTIVSLIEKNTVAKQKLESSFKLLKNKNKALIMSNDTKNTFFSIIAHDLRNPIQIVIGYTGMLIDNYHNMSIEEVKAYFKDIESATIKLLQLLENLLNWSRSQTETIPFNPFAQPLLHVVETACQPTHMGAKNKNIMLKLAIPPQLQAFIDKNLIMTVVRNIVTNAIKFTNTGGSITVSATKLDAEKVVLKIEDTGVGMSYEECQKLFKIDKKFSKRGTNGEIGTGLGLILSKEFIEKSGGNIKVESTQGEGTTFIIILPAKEFRTATSYSSDLPIQ